MDIKTRLACGYIDYDPSSDDVMHETLLEMYNEDLDKLYELQKNYENGEIEYSEYERFALYMSERYKYMMNLYDSMPLDKKMNLFLG